MASKIIDAHESWFVLDEASGALRSADIALSMLGEEATFDFNNPQEAARAQERVIVLLEAAQSNLASARAVISREVAVLQSRPAALT